MSTDVTTAPRATNPRCYFLELSGELRHMIYEFALTDRKQPLIVIRKTASPWWDPSSPPPPWDFPVERIYQIYERLLIWKWRRLPGPYRQTIAHRSYWTVRMKDEYGLSPNILATCRQINAEATSFLYENNLCFQEGYAFRSFSYQIGESAQFLRTLRFDIQYYPQFMLDLSKIFTKATNLKSVIFHRSCCGEVDEVLEILRSEAAKYDHEDVESCRCIAIKLLDKIPHLRALRTYDIRGVRGALWCCFRCGRVWDSGDHPELEPLYFATVRDLESLRVEWNDD